MWDPWQPMASFTPLIIDERSNQTPNALSSAPTPPMSAGGPQLTASPPSGNSASGLASAAQDGGHLSPFDDKEERGVNIFVAGLTQSITDKSFEALFSSFGRILSAKVMLDVSTGTSRGYGFLLFENDEEGRRAMHEMDGKPLGPNTLHISVSEHDGHVVRCNTIYVRNLPLNVSERELVAKFATLGPIVRCSLKKDNSGNYNTQGKYNLASIEFKNVEDAQVAIKFAHGNKPFEQCTIPLLAKFAESVESREARRLKRLQRGPGALQLPPPPAYPTPIQSATPTQMQQLSQPAAVQQQQQTAGISSQPYSYNMHGSAHSPGLSGAVSPLVPSWPSPTQVLPYSPVQQVIMVPSQGGSQQAVMMTPTASHSHSPPQLGMTSLAPQQQQQHPHQHAPQSAQPQTTYVVVQQQTSPSPQQQQQQLYYASQSQQLSSTLSSLSSTVPNMTRNSSASSISELSRTTSSNVMAGQPLRPPSFSGLVPSQRQLSGTQLLTPQQQYVHPSPQLPLVPGAQLQQQLQAAPSPPAAAVPVPVGYSLVPQYTSQFPSHSGQIAQSGAILQVPQAGASPLTSYQSVPFNQQQLSQVHQHQHQQQQQQQQQHVLHHPQFSFRNQPGQ